MEGPWLTTTGKKKGKKRWATAEQKAKAERLNESWTELKAKWGVSEQPKRQQWHTKETLKVGPKYPPGREPQEIKSLDTGWGVCAKPADKFYTGTKCKGVGTMHKSNAVPIFSDEEAVDISKMRR